MAGKIPQNFIDDLITRTDIVALINARVPLKRKGKEHSACCPFHNEKTPSFTVSEAKQFYYCFGCHAKGNAIGFLMDYEHLGYIEAIESLADDLHLDIPRETGQHFYQDKIDLQPFYNLLAKTSQLFCQQLKIADKAINYLKQRGVSGEIAQRYKIGYAPSGWNYLTTTLNNESDKTHLLEMGLIVKKENQQTYDRFRDRIMFPISDQRGRIVGFGGRILDQGEPKYLNSAENKIFHKGLELYGLYEAKQALRNIERLLIVEGYMDVVALAQHGIDYAVASLGTATTTEQIQKTFRTTHEIVFCYDGDNAGKKAAWRALENTLTIIRDGQIAKFLLLPEKEDPDTLVGKEGKQAFEARINKAMPLSEFFFTRLKQQFDITSNEGKAQLADKANKLLNSLHNSLFKDMLLKELSNLVGLSEKKLSAHLIDRTPQTQTINRVKLSNNQQIIISKTRIAIALLLQNPSLAQSTKIPDSFKFAYKKGLPLLHTLQKTINLNPDISASALLERFRNTKEEKILQTLSLLSTPETNNQETISTIYHDIISRLNQQDRHEFLTDKVKNNQSLTNEETNEYLALSQVSKK